MEFFRIKLPVPQSVKAIFACKVKARTLNSGMSFLPGVKNRFAESVNEQSYKKKDSFPYTWL